VNQTGFSSSRRRPVLHRSASAQHPTHPACRITTHYRPYGSHTPFPTAFEPGNPPGTPIRIPCFEYPVVVTSGDNHPFLDCGGRLSCPSPAWIFSTCGLFLVVAVTCSPPALFRCSAVGPGGSRSTSPAPSNPNKPAHLILLCPPGDGLGATSPLFPRDSAHAPRGSRSGTWRGVSRVCGRASCAPALSGVCPLNLPVRYDWCFQGVEFERDLVVGPNMNASSLVFVSPPRIITQPTSPKSLRHFVGGPHIRARRQECCVTFFSASLIGVSGGVQALQALSTTAVSICRARSRASLPVGTRRLHQGIRGQAETLWSALPAFARQSRADCELYLIIVLPARHLPIP